VLVLSDCLEPPEAVGRGLSSLARNKLLLARVIDPVERSLPLSGDAIVEDLESPRTLRTHIGARRRERYRERLREHVEAVAEQTRTLGARYEVVGTDADVFDSFGQVWMESRLQ
jgi:uncharacterized protein (DUF58 family)